MCSQFPGNSMFSCTALFCKELGWEYAVMFCLEKHSLMRFRVHPFLLLRNNLHFPWMAEGRSSSCICQTAVGILSSWVWLGCHMPCIILNRGWREALCSCHLCFRELQMFRAACARVKWGLVVCSGGSLSRWVWVDREMLQGCGWGRLPSWLYATLGMERQRRVLKAESCREVWEIWHLWRPLE